MQRFVSSIGKSIQTGNWYAALSMSLTLPDICGWLENPKLTSQKRYEAWFERYLLKKYLSPFHGPNFTFLSGSDCYALRCAYLHEGTDDVERQRAKDAIGRFAFSTTGSHCCKFNSVLLLNVGAFCSDICAGVEAWSKDVTGNQEIQSRVQELLTVRTEGFQVIPGVFVQ